MGSLYLGAETMKLKGSFKFLEFEVPFGVDMRLRVDMNRDSRPLLEWWFTEFVGLPSCIRGVHMRTTYGLNAN